MLNEASSLQLNSTSYTRFPFAGFRIEPGSISPGDCTIVSYYRLFDPTPLQTIEQRRNKAPQQAGDTTPRFVARVLRVQTQAEEWKVEEAWAVQETCPALTQTLEQLTNVLAFRFTAAGPHEFFVSAMDASLYAFWARGQMYPSPDMGYSFNLETNSSVGTPLAIWIDAALAAIRPCLTATRPTTP